MSEVTLGEIARLQAATREDIAVLRTEVQSRPDWDDIKRVEKGLEARILVLSTSLGKLEGWGNWATKLAGGAIIAAVLFSAGIGPP